MNFGLLDFEGPFAWPRDHRNGSLLVWLQRMNREYDRGQLQTQQLPHGSGSAHAFAAVEEFSDLAQRRYGEISGNPELQQSYPEQLFKLRVCMAPNTPMRVWGTLNLEEERGGYVFRPIWWDPEHGVWPMEAQDSLPGRPCDEDLCLHQGLNLK